MNFPAFKWKYLALGVACVLAVAVPVLLTRSDVWTWSKMASDSLYAMTWQGFGPEKGLYNFTVVTALLDIGRGGWSAQSRGYNTYLLYMQRLLRMDINLVVFVEAKGGPFIQWMRRGRENRTKIVDISLKDLPYYRYRSQIQKIMDSKEYQQDNELVQTDKCESKIPEYDILQLSKLYFMDRAVRENPFNTTYFMWLDAGYGHGEDVYPDDGVWIPRGLFEHSTQITFIERHPGAMHFYPQRHRLHKLSINILAGLFFAGGGDAFAELYKLQQQKLREWLKHGIIDDDQTMYMALYFRKPSLFNLVRGDWFDVFKLFHHVPR